MTTIKLPTVIVTDAVIPNEKNLLRKLSSAIRNIELKYKYSHLTTKCLNLYIIKIEKSEMYYLCSYSERSNHVLYMYSHSE